MTETEMTTDEILNSIRQMLSTELSEEKKQDQSLPSVSELTDIFVLTPEMRCDEKTALQEKMYRVLDKMNQKSIAQPLDSDWKVE